MGDTNIETSISTSSLTSSQERTLASLSLIAGSLSLLSSATIIYLVLRSARMSPYKRILLGLSAIDMVASFTYATAPFLLPAETSTRAWAKGTPATCNFGGFLNQLSFSAFWYNGFLSFYYLATVRLGMSTRVFAKKWEPWVHILSVGWNLGAASLSVVFNIYEEAELGQLCWIGEVPKNCLADDPTGSSCHGGTIGWGLAGIWALVFFLAVIINNVIIYRHVRNTIARSKATSLSGATTLEERAKSVATQGFLYVGSFLFTYCWAFAVRIMEASGMTAAEEDRFYILYILQAIFLPMQGCFNLLIYVRPNLIQCQKDYPNEPILWSLHRVLCHKGQSRDNMDSSLRGTSRSVFRRFSARWSNQMEDLNEIPSLRGKRRSLVPSESTRSTGPDASSRRSQTHYNLNNSQSHWPAFLEESESGESDNVKGSDMNNSRSHWPDLTSSRMSRTESECVDTETNEKCNRTAHQPVIIEGEPGEETSKELMPEELTEVTIEKELELPAVEHLSEGSSESPLFNASQKQWIDDIIVQSGDSDCDE
eukprot:Nitzschia sp. Nitz4//scaffold23_size168460//81228//82844//NITZ4_002220-RA/size168460-processed-gene-0.124-mRNA-1//-1//CDS//3329543638//5664//frame0